MDTKDKLALQTALKQLIGNPREIEAFKKEPDEYLKKMEIECSLDLKYEIAGLLRYMEDDWEWCPMPPPFPRPFLSAQLINKYLWDEFVCGTGPRPIPFPVPKYEEFIKQIINDVKKGM